MLHSISCINVSLSNAAIHVTLIIIIVMNLFEFYNVKNCYDIIVPLKLLLIHAYYSILFKNCPADCYSNHRSVHVTMYSKYIDKTNI